MNSEITIIDNGRGPQLSTSRITVQDLVPYFQLKYSYDEILQIMPTLTVAEIQAVERYVNEHHDEVMEEDRRIRERNAARRNPSHVEEIFRRTREKWPTLEAAYRKYYGEEANGDRHSG
ncbi:MAG: hypothetical protein B7Z73_05305 [Planctomycetia bacterium 21-64-5]|nr:MAG: hypothetical protein B7Z73_05305 [Planctomycetia bacterium 21-64-5]HQU42882.1 DUF433 domain-containing protein [Pirellulales bacterium]